MTRRTYAVRDGEIVEKVWGGEARPCAVKQTVEGFASRSLPKKWPFADQWDSAGRPVFTGRRNVEECVAKAVDHGEPVVYDFDDGT